MGACDAGGSLGDAPCQPRCASPREAAAAWQGGRDGTPLSGAWTWVVPWESRPRSLTAAEAVSKACTEGRVDEEGPREAGPGPPRGCVSCPQGRSVWDSSTAKAVRAL